MELEQKGFSKSGRLQVIEMNGEKYFSSQEVARRLGVCASSFYNLKRKFNLQGVLVGKRKYYSEKELTEVIFNRSFENL